MSYVPHGFEINTLGAAEASKFLTVDSNIDVKHLKDLALQPEPSIATGALMLVWLFIASGMMFFFKKRAREIYLGFFILYLCYLVIIA